MDLSIYRTGKDLSWFLDFVLSFFMFETGNFVTLVRFYSNE